MRRRRPQRSLWRCFPGFKTTFNSATAAATKAQELAAEQAAATRAASKTHAARAARYMRAHKAFIRAHRAYACLQTLSQAFVSLSTFALLAFVHPSWRIEAKALRARTLVPLTHTLVCLICNCRNAINDSSIGELVRDILRAERRPLPEPMAPSAPPALPSSLHLADKNAKWSDEMDVTAKNSILSMLRSHCGEEDTDALRDSDLSVDTATGIEDKTRLAVQKLIYRSLLAATAGTVLDKLNAMAIGPQFFKGACGAEAIQALFKPVKPGADTESGGQTAICKLAEANLNIFPDRFS